MKPPKEKGEGVFPTRNAALALALMTAGAETAPPHITNLYTITKLKELKVASASEAEKKGIPGVVTYYFRTSERLQSLLAAWDAQRELIQRQEKGGEKTAELDIEDEAFMRVASQLLHNRGSFMRLWRQTVGLLKIDNETGNGFRIISTNASPELRKRLGL